MLVTKLFKKRKSTNVVGNNIPTTLNSSSISSSSSASSSSIHSTSSSSVSSSTSSPSPSKKNSSPKINSSNINNSNLTSQIQKLHLDDTLSSSLSSSPSNSNTADVNEHQLHQQQSSNHSSPKIILELNHSRDRNHEPLLNNDEEDEQSKGGEEDQASSDEVDNMYSSSELNDDNNDDDDQDDDQEEQDEDDDDDDDDDIFDGFRDVESELVSRGMVGGSRTLDADQLIEEQKREINEVAQLLSITFNQSHTLLKHFNWKREKLLTRYFESTQEVCTEAGIEYQAGAESQPQSQSQHHQQAALIHNNDPISSSGSTTMNMNESSSSTTIFGCSICGDDDQDTESTSLATCGHSICNGCWAQYLGGKINEGEANIRCPFFKCVSVVDDLTIKHLVAPFLYQKYESFATKKFVQHSEMRWCPTPGCESIVTSDSSDTSLDVVQCSQCLFRFCIKCHRESHLPCSCEQMSLWDQKCRDESETTHWKSVNCKSCPKCQSQIEKNGGCNHMTCRSCTYEWCWVCMRPWKGHQNFYICNKVNKEPNTSTKKSILPWKRSKKQKELIEIDEKLKNSLALERYLHYSDKFINHDNTRKLEKVIREEAKAKMEEMEKFSTWLEAQYIEKGIEQLLECKCILKHTYIYAFFSFESELTKNMEPRLQTAKDLFEFLQDDLENTTQQLSGLMEETLKKSVTPNSQQRIEIMNVTSLAKSKVFNLLNAILKDSIFEQ